MLATQVLLHKDMVADGMNLYLLRPGADICLLRVLPLELFRAGFEATVSAEKLAAQDLMRTPEVGLMLGGHSTRCLLTARRWPSRQPRSPERRGVRMNTALPGQHTLTLHCWSAEDPSLSLRTERRSTAAGVSTGKAWSEREPGPGVT